MTTIRLALAVLTAASVWAADAPLPELRTEAVNAGSVFHVRNTAGQAVTAFYIELVDYPGSQYYLWVDEPGQSLAPGATRDIPVTNMTVGAVPDQVKLQAALFAGGGSAGAADKVALLKGRRQALLEATRELIRRLQAAGGTEAAKASLAEWSGSLPALTRSNRYTAAGINQAAVAGLIGETSRWVAMEGVAVVVQGLRVREGWWK